MDEKKAQKIADVLIKAAALLAVSQRAFTLIVVLLILWTIDVMKTSVFFVGVIGLMLVKEATRQLAKKKVSELHSETEKTGVRK